MEQLHNLNAPGISPAPAMIYDPERVQRVVQIFERVLRRPDGPFQPCYLVPCEIDFISRNFGYVDEAGYNHRRIEVPRVWYRLDTVESGGSGLSIDVFAAGLTLAMLMGGFGETEIYVSAPAKAARGILRAAATMVDLSPQLRTVLTVSRERTIIVHRRRPLLAPGWADRWCCKVITADNLARDLDCVITTRRQNG